MFNMIDLQSRVVQLESIVKSQQTEIKELRGIIEKLQNTASDSTSTSLSEFPIASDKKVKLSTPLKYGKCEPLQ